MNVSRKPKVAAIQMQCEPNPAVNVKNAFKQIVAAAQAGANVICLQELFNCQYPCQAEDHRNFDLAEPIPGPTSESLANAARELGIVIVASLFERRAAGIYHNTAIVIDRDGSEVGRYRKMHIPDDPSFYEKFYFTPGDLGFQSFPTAYGNIGVCVCWDQWFPEAARITALKGAEIIVYPTAIGSLVEEKEEYGASQFSAWETVMRSHAITNGVFVVAPNRTGLEGQIDFWGGSFICDPNGNLLATASRDQPEIVAAECDLDSIDVIRTHWPFLRDRRIDAYDGVLKRYLDDDQ